MNKISVRTLVSIIVLMTSPLLYGAKPKACVGVNKQCTKDVRTDKTIDGKEYSCYQCKQVVCKSGGSGPIAGTETTSVCESKAPSGRTLIKTRHELQFDEADAIFAKRSEVKGAHPKPQSTTTKIQRTKSVDHRKTKSVIKKPNKGTKHRKNEQIIAPNNRSSIDHRQNKTVQKKPARGTKGPISNQLATPTQVTLYDVTPNQLSISWMDNAYNEYGVSVERGMPQDDRGGINYNWQHVFNVEERIDSNVKSTGWRTDGDDGLASNTEYCYRLRAYHKKQYSNYSSTVCTSTK